MAVIVAAKEGYFWSVSQSNEPGAAGGFVIVRPQQTPGAIVTIDGNDAGRPGERLAVLPGRHRVEVRLPGGGSVTRFVDVQAGGVAIVNGDAPSSAPLRPRIELLNRQTVTVSPNTLSNPVPVTAGTHVRIGSAGRVRAFLPGRIVDLAPGRSTLPIWQTGAIRLISLEATEQSVMVEILR